MNKEQLQEKLIKAENLKQNLHDSFFQAVGQVETLKLLIKELEENTEG